MYRNTYFEMLRLVRLSAENGVTSRFIADQLGLERKHAGRLLDRLKTLKLVNVKCINEGKIRRHL